jgi:DNA (cytosine-5)-methyltransferase 1
VFTATGTPKPNPVLSEWLMGLPEGWVTDPALGLTLAQQLTALGNGVVPAQAQVAIRYLTAAYLPQQREVPNPSGGALSQGKNSGA